MNKVLIEKKLAGIQNEIIEINKKIKDLGDELMWEEHGSSCASSILKEQHEYELKQKALSTEVENMKQALRLDSFFNQNTKVPSDLVDIISDYSMLP